MNEEKNGKPEAKEGDTKKIKVKQWSSLYLIY